MRARLPSLLWDVASVNDIGLGAMRMHDKGFQKGWGLGRHVLGSNYFHYVQDPWGSFSEYSCDIDYIPKEERWPAADHEPEDSFYLWGPDVPREFTDQCRGRGGVICRLPVVAGLSGLKAATMPDMNREGCRLTATILTSSPALSRSCGRAR